MTDFKKVIARLAEGETLSADLSSEAFKVMMSGEATTAQIGAFLMALRVRGETVEELTGAAKTMRHLAVSVEAPEGAIDTCGTGGDAKGTYNISTCAAFVVAACGVPVAKHGNRSVSSKSGSADVLEALGVNLDMSPEQTADSIRKTGIGFMYAPAYHAAMKHVGPARKDLAIRTIFNLLGPLANPAKTKHQLIGVFAKEWIAPLLSVVKNLGLARVWIVHGSDGMDELTTTGPSTVGELKNGKTSLFEISPEEAGLDVALPSDLLGGGAEDNALAIGNLLAGQKGAFRDIVLLNAAAALIVSGKVENLSEGVERAAQAVDSGQARARLDALVSYG